MSKFFRLFAKACPLRCNRDFAKSWLSALGVSAVCAVTAIYIGGLLPLFAASWGCVYIAMRRLPVITLLTVLGIAVVASLLPWFGVGVGVMIYPGSHTPLPLLNYPKGMAAVMQLLYAVAEMPLLLLKAVGGDRVVEELSFDTSGAPVRPFFVFAWWCGVLVCASAATVATLAPRKLNRCQ